MPATSSAQATSFGQGPRCVLVYPTTLQIVSAWAPERTRPSLNFRCPNHAPKPSSITPKRGQSQADGRCIMLLPTSYSGVRTAACTTPNQANPHRPTEPRMNRCPWLSARLPASRITPRVFGSLTFYAPRRAYDYIHVCSRV